MRGEVTASGELLLNAYPETEDKVAIEGIFFPSKESWNSLPYPVTGYTWGFYIDNKSVEALEIGNLGEFAINLGLEVDEEGEYPSVSLECEVVITYIDFFVVTEYVSDLELNSIRLIVDGVPGEWIEVAG